MKRFLRMLGIVLVLSIIATSCEKAPFLTLSTPKTISFTEQGGTQSITFTANRDWSVSSSDSWCKVSPSSGNKADGNITVTLTCEPNTTYDPRNATLTIRVEELSETILVEQSQTDGLFVEKPEYTVSRDAQTIEVEVQANVPFEVSTDAGWIHYVETKALVSSKVVLSIDANDTYNPRQGIIKVVGKEGAFQRIISISQEQTDALFITDESKEYLIASGGGTIAVNVFHNIDFEVETASFPEWLSYTVKNIDNNNAQISFSVKKNTEYVGRKVSLTIKGKDLTDSFSISQHQVDVLYVDNQKLDFAWDGTALSVRVYSNVDYSIDNPSWITTEHGVTTEEGYLKVDTYSIIPEENLDVEREGNLTIIWSNEGVESSTMITIKQDKWLITLNEAGGLIDIITNDRLRKMKALTIAGEVNGTDVLYIRRMEQLRYLNLLDARIVAGGVSYVTIGGEVCYSSDDVIGHYMFAATDNFRSLEEVILPSTVKEVGFYSFRAHWHLTKLIIPESVKLIASLAFCECSDLRNVDLPSQLEVLEDASFYACNISEVTLPSTLKRLGQHALSCPNIIVHIKALPSTLSSIGYLPFGDADNATVYVPRGYLTDYLLTPIGDYVNIYEE